MVVYRNGSGTAYALAMICPIIFYSGTINIYKGEKWICIVTSAISSVIFNISPAIIRRYKRNSIVFTSTNTIPDNRSNINIAPISW